MSRRGRVPGYHGRNIQQAARTAERSFFRGGKPGTASGEKRREATADVVAMCALVALNRSFGLGEERLRRVADRAGVTAQQFELAKMGVGWAKAKAKLDADVEEVFHGDFVLPVIVAPTKPKEWAALGEQREAADVLVKFYIKALRDVMGFGKDRTAAFVQAVEREYREFGEFAKDGDYYGYYKLARDMETILREKVFVDESEAAEPFFGKTLD